MNFPEKEIVSGTKSFVSEKDLEERRQKRQEEWEKTRKPDDPLEAPEEEYDHRTLYERLQENKMKKEADYEEQHKLKNMIRGLDSDEVSFLESVDETRLREERLKEQEESQALDEFRKACSHLTQEEQAKKMTEFKKSLWVGGDKKDAASASTSSQQRKSLSGQAALISKVVKRKVPPSSTLTSDDQPQNKRDCNEPKDDSNTVAQSPSTLKVVGILPGIGYYGSDSSDSERSDSDSDLDGKGGLTISFPLKPKVRSTKSDACS